MIEAVAGHQDLCRHEGAGGVVCRGEDLGEGLELVAECEVGRQIVSEWTDAVCLGVLDEREPEEECV